jgi:hypothetical protein
MSWRIAGERGQIAHTAYQPRTTPKEPSGNVSLNFPATLDAYMTFLLVGKLLIILKSYIVLSFLIVISLDYLQDI